MRWIYLSPHLDDAVLSAGGWIYEQARAGVDVEIWSFMCGFPPAGEISPFAQMLHHQWGIAAAEALVNARRAEDFRAAKRVSARAIHFDFLDCIYRRGKNGDWLYSNVFVPPHEDESELPAQIAAAIAPRLKPDDQLICQFAIGPHLDHLLVRRAAELLERPLFYAADIPYLFNTPNDLAQKITGMQEHTYKVSSFALTAWQDGIAEYKSQLGGLFESVEDMRAKISAYAADYDGIRLWR